ncbi:hypothetical protein SAMN02910358_00851 [Lachnospiraceae bacterium XBB1006]|nr:hypothetical protein SAMN02910358_00851 [Lachnospiraceae bacterium XBB1006]
MFRLWAKEWKDNHLVTDYTYEREVDDTRTHMILAGLNEICYELDLCVPIWLDHNIKEFQRTGKTRFYQDNFMEGIAFDYLEFQIIDEV